MAFTLKEGRTALDQRRVVVAETHAEAADLLEADDPRRVFTHTALDRPDMCFMFPGGGAQYAGMARELYETEPVFAEWMDRGLEHLQPKLDYDIRALWLPEKGSEAAANAALTKPSVQLPLIMITEYALAQMFMGWGVEPQVLVGHSMGENTAACLAGVMSFEDCIGLVHLRGRLFDTVPAGGMLSVPLSLDALQPYLDDDHDIASINAPELTVISGPQAALDRLQAKLAADAVEATRVAIDIAAHSRMLDPILTAFGDYLRSIPLHAPRLPIVSNLTGEALTDAQATDPDYWVQHLRGTVRFADCIGTLSARPRTAFTSKWGRARRCPRWRGCTARCRGNKCWPRCATRTKRSRMTCIIWACWRASGRWAARSTGRKSGARPSATAWNCPATPSSARAISSNRALRGPIPPRRWNGWTISPTGAPRSHGNRPMPIARSTWPPTWAATRRHGWSLPMRTAPPPRSWTGCAAPATR